MGFRLHCKHCGGDGFQVFWDITRGGMIQESALNLKCVKCGTEYVATPRLDWDFEDYTHAVVTALDDGGNPVEVPKRELETVTKRLEEAGKE